MARPTKEAEKLRTETLRVRVTPDEKSQILLNAKMANFTVSDFFRHLAMRAKVKRRVPDFDQEILIKLKGEVGKVGSNLNQIAKEINRRRLMNDPEQIPEHIITTALYGVDTLTKHLLEILGYGD